MWQKIVKNLSQGFKESGDDDTSLSFESPHDLDLAVDELAEVDLNSADLADDDNPLSAETQNDFSENQALGDTTSSFTEAAPDNSSDAAWIAEQQMLAQRFGGVDRWLKLRQQLSQWGKQNLPPALYQELASKSDGVTALYRLMSSETEPKLSRPGQAKLTLSAEQLRRLMMEPRYWRDHDSQTIAEVTAGFRRLYDQD